MRDVFDTPPSSDDDVSESTVVMNVSHQVRVENEDVYLHDVDNEFSIFVSEGSKGDDDALDNEGPGIGIESFDKAVKRKNHGKGLVDIFSVYLFHELPYQGCPSKIGGWQRGHCRLRLGFILDLLLPFFFLLLQVPFDSLFNCKLYRLMCKRICLFFFGVGLAFGYLWACLGNGTKTPISKSTTLCRFSALVGQSPRSNESSIMNGTPEDRPGASNLTRKRPGRPRKDVVIEELNRVVMEQDEHSSIR
ncbi:hypothetical protein L7F22_057040 [Adiantum nelumboides]|nr:hypothetical protein [Adiantum nelumboides]